MLNQISTLIPQATACSQQDITHSRFGVIDKKPCIITDIEEENWHFAITNNSDPITFLAVDRCLFNESVSSCDFIVFNNREFCFVEIKDTTRRRSPTMPKAIRQLEATIQFFHILNYAGYELKAYTSFRNKKETPTASTSFQSSKLRFWDSYQVELYDDNEKVFV